MSDASSPPAPYQSWASYRFDQRLAEACKAKDIRLQDLAAEVPISEQALRNIRHGLSIPRAETIARIEKAAGWADGGYQEACEDKEPTPRSKRSPSDRLAYLVRAVHAEDGKPRTSREVAKALREKGFDVTSSQVDRLMETWTGAPEGIEAALADFFGVPAGYFTDDSVADDVERELALLTALRDSGVKKLALRAAGLSPRSLESLTAMVDSAREIEGLPKGNP